LPYRNIGTTDILVSLIFWDKNIGIALLSKSQYPARAPWSKILATPLVFGLNLLAALNQELKYLEIT